MPKEKKWILKDAADKETVSRLASELGVDPVLALLLVQRGVATFQEARAFFRPDLKNLHDPFLMTDMDRAVERLRRAIEGGEKILVYGDYDVDGTTAVSLVYSFLRRLTLKVDFYIPDRYDEGYGVSFKGIDWAGENGFSLIITLDCGIKANEKVEYAAGKNIDMIICDHHLPENELPAAVAVLDPKRADCAYPFDDLSGCGVGFKLVQAYSEKYGIPFETLVPLLDLLVVSIASDLVSVTGENRILAHFGLKRMNENPRVGLLSMMRLSGLEPSHVGIDDIVFKIGPRINAAGRMESGRVAVELLTATDEKEAAEIAGEINEYNNERKDIDRRITQEALEMVRGGTCLSFGNATIVYNPDWHKGVVGIVASRLVEAFYKPTIVFTRSNGFVTGSARSVQGFDLIDDGLDPLQLSLAVRTKNFLNDIHCKICSIRSVCMATVRGPPSGEASRKLFRGTPVRRPDFLRKTLRLPALLFILTETKRLFNVYRFLFSRNTPASVTVQPSAEQ